FIARRAGRLVPLLHAKCLSLSSGRHRVLVLAGPAAKSGRGRGFGLFVFAGPLTLAPPLEASPTGSRRAYASSLAGPPVKLPGYRPLCRWPAVARPAVADPWRDREPAAPVRTLREIDRTLSVPHSAARPSRHRGPVAPSPRCASSPHFLPGHPLLPGAATI